MIEQYSFGQMTVKGRGYHQDLKIIRGEVVGNWWRNEGHRLDLEDIEDILSANPDVLVVGTGYSGYMRVPDSLVSTFNDRGIRLIAVHTADAMNTFNRLSEKGENVAGAFHLTC